jgi:L,D-peptidoglycan transpeptidase YkuD (ErfK/YbiS/YcfS/YnhG family)
MIITVTAQNGGPATLNANDGEFPAAIGPAGITKDKYEGDGATPAGRFPFRAVYFRPDRLASPVTALPVYAIQTNDGWCDAPEDPLYNRAVKLPYPSSAEAFWRDDGVYDLLVVLGHNDGPVVPGAGSAIFLHIARADFAPTQGCVAVTREVLLGLIECLDGESVIEINAT